MRLWDGTMARIVVMGAKGFFDAQFGKIEPIIVDSEIAAKSRKVQVLGSTGF